VTIAQLIEALASHPALVGGLLSIPPLAAWILVAVHGPGRGDLRPWRYLHAVLLHASVFPGVLALLLLGYELLMRRGDLLALDVVVCFYPPVAMALTLAGIRRATAFEHLPGAGRLRGFITSVAVAFLLALIAMRTGIRLIFFQSVWMFVIFVAILYAFLRWGLRATFQGRRPPPGGR